MLRYLPMSEISTAQFKENTMNRYSSFAVLLPLAMLTIGALHADTIYRDPRNRFTINVPTGWGQSAADGSMQLTRGDAYVTLMTVDAQDDARALVSGAVQQISRAWTAIRPVGS